MKVSVRGRLGPGPAEAGHHPGVLASRVTLRERGFEAHGIGDNVDSERRRRELGHAGLADLEQLVDPVDVLVGSGAPELRAQIDLLEPGLVPDRRLVQERGTADLIGADRLVIVDKKDRDLRCLDDLVDLRAI